MTFGSFLAYGVAAWLGVSATVTLGWCGLVEFCCWQDRRRRQVSGSGASFVRGNPNKPEPDSTVLAVVRATGTPLPIERDASHSSPSGSLGKASPAGRLDQDRATTRRLNIVH